MFKSLFKKGKGCWEWRGTKSTDGYGLYKGEYAHRINYEKYKGKIINKYHVHHICKNKKCVNPEHLKLVSIYEHNAIHKKTNKYCRNGHLLDVKNTRWYKNYRICRKCHNNNERKRWYKKFKLPRLNKINSIKKEVAKGKNKKEIALKFKVSIRTIYRYKKI